jgi:hypothetical protein
MQHLRLRSVAVPCPPLKFVVRRFWSHIGEGHTAAEAAVAVGVSMHTGRLWFAAVGGVAPRISKPKTVGTRRRLTFADRVEIEIGVRTNESLQSIGRRLGRPASTIKNEIDVNATKNCADGRKSGYRRKNAFGAHQSGKTAQVQYRAMLAQARSEVRARRPKIGRLAERERLREEVQTRLEDFHRPAQIAVRLRREFRRRSGDVGVTRNHLSIDLRARTRQPAERSAPVSAHWTCTAQAAAPHR